MASVVYSDIIYNVSIDPKGNVILVTDGDAVSQSIKTILATYPGERIMEPEFGSRLRDLLFEPIDDITASFIEEEVKDSINRWDDRVLIQNVQAIPDEDNNHYVLNVIYVVKTTNQTGQFVTAVRAIE